MPNTLSIREVTLRQVTDCENACNVIAPAGSAPTENRLHPWQGLTVRITDHVDDETGEEANAEKMALFHSKCYGAPWEKYRGGDRAVIFKGTAIVEDVAPEDATLIYPNFDYNDPQWAKLS